ncbi:MAG TPA: MBL fold metallo-hydrolase [Microthrixaceae bacterium]|nr:MBL fold metallo-hydrolase [Microthrixaceae bacterium]
MQITIHRGTHEIGGNCIEIATDRTRIILDIGMPLFNEDREPHDSAQLRRHSAEELRRLGILPQVPGLFEDGPALDAILLSHAHEDHTGLIRHSRSEIPIYAGVGTSKMMLAGAKFAGQPTLPRNRHRELPAGQTVQIGDFAVTVFSVDHSIYGAQAFLIEAEGRAVLYSGDLRLHGRKPGMHRSLIEAVKDRAIDVLLMEGTHISHADHRGPNEYELEDEITEQVRSAPGLVMASFSPQHVDRLVGFYRSTIKAGRTFVADAYTAFVMHLLASETSIPRPESAENVKVFFPKFFLETFEKKRLEGFFSLMSPARIGVEEIRSYPSRYVMLFRPSMLESDFGGTLPPGTRCLYSRWTGYLDRPDWQPVKDALAKADGDLIEVHTSGHIFHGDIVDLVGQLSAKLVVPIHTFEPEKFQAFLSTVKLMADGETMSL